MATLGNSEAVRAANAKERRPTRPSPARETAEARTRETPEREPKRRELDEYDERAEDLRRAVPGITDETIADLLKPYKLR